MYNIFCSLYLLQLLSLFFILNGRIPSGQTSSYEEPMDVDNSVETDYGRGSGWVEGGEEGKSGTTGIP